MILSRNTFGFGNSQFGANYFTNIIAFYLRSMKIYKENIINFDHEFNKTANSEQRVYIEEPIY